MAQSEPDPFAFLITANCHVTASQSALHRAAPFVRHYELFPGDSSSSSSQYHIPVETTAIRMESPPPEEDEFLTPQEDSLPPATSPEPMVVERETRVSVEPQRKKNSVREFVLSLKRADKVFDKMSMRKQVTKMSLIQCTSTQIINLDEHEECGDLPIRNSTVTKKGPSEYVSTGEVENAHNKDVEPCRNGNGGSANKGIVDLPKGDHVYHKGKGAKRVLPSWTMNKDGFLVKDGPNKEIKRDCVEKNMFETDKSNSDVERSRGLDGSDLPSSVSGKTKEDEIMKNLLDGLDLVSSIESDKIELYKKADILETVMRRGLMGPRPSWWAQEKKIPGVGEGSGCV